MNAKDSSITPKKAENAPLKRPPLELLVAEYVEAYQAHQASFDEHPDGPGIMLGRRHIADAAHRLVQADRALIALDPAALRAQAPAAAATGDDALAREVHAAWRDGMLGQGREVAPHRMTWDTLSPEDHALDAYIALRVAGVAQRAQAEAETVESVMAAAKAANQRDRPLQNVPDEEYNARLDVIDTGRAYASALMQLDRLQEQRAAFHDAQARLAAALAQAGGE